MYSGLDNDGARLLRLLVSRLANAVPNRPETFITYKEVHTVLGLKLMGSTLGISLRLQGMDSLAGWAADRGLPAITGLIVNEDARVPGNSYFTSNGRNPNSDFKWWENEIVKAKAQDWLRLDQPAISDGTQAGNFSTKHVALPIEESSLGTAEAIKPGDLSKDKTLSEEAKRIADLVYGRVTASGYVFKGVRPTRSAPENFLLQVAERLRKVPLSCALCGGLMQLQPSNKLLQPSPDRIDSNAASYGPENFQLVHLACNLAKNNATAAQFAEWLQIIKSVGPTND